ncbi:hypothetical protein CIW48_29500 [Methylobacterium sp. P1-11]|uniref:hypothetical protein n=1 Tax=Methylobacterium sp. P1-11 TaxID=2024616 RepID=UPI0011ECE70A|nr:hypothetical protein [Methylobacterium sp. P1-11]KAA0113497.1 hypothetical protein CIW48_29500 [Methylobacterium sp. P1-11]
MNFDFAVGGFVGSVHSQTQETLLVPNYAFNRLTVTGLPNEIARFVGECIRIRDDQPNELPSLDLDALVPMPSQILATCGRGDAAMRKTASAAAGLPDWFYWRAVNWGTKWNTCAFFGGVISETIYDCQFDTAWSCLEPALSTLAARYPRLRGTVIAHDASNDWSLIAVFREGRYLSAIGGYDQRFGFFVDAGHALDAVGVASAKALISIVDDPELFGATLSSHSPASSVSTSDTLWNRRELAIEQFGRFFGSDLPRRLAFERTVFDLCDIADDQPVKTAADAARYSGQTEADVRFLTACDRTRTPVDRKLMTILAMSVRSDGMYDHDDATSEEHHRLIEEEILDSFLVNELSDWASAATCRSGVTLDSQCEETLQASFLSYADGLRNDILDHLRASTDCASLFSLTVNP